MSQAFQSPARERLSGAWLALGAGVVSLGVYVATLAPTIGYGDSPELTAAALTLGVPHPTGYPLYTLLAHGWAVAFAVGDLAWRVNLLSALLGAVAVACLTALGQQLTRSRRAAWVCGLAFAFSPAFWAHATLAEVYALQGALIAGLILALVRFEAEGQRSWLRGAAFLGGLGLANHVTTALLIPAAALAVLRRRDIRRDPAELARLLGLGALPLLFYAYLPLSAATGPAVNWGAPSSASAFWYHVSGGQYREFLGGSPGALLEAALATLARLPSELTWGLSAVAVLGAVLQARADARRFAWMALAGGLSLLFALFYRVADAEAYLLAASIVSAAWLAIGTRALIDVAERRWPHARASVGAAALLTPLVPLLLHIPGQDRSADFEAHDRTVAALSAAPSGAMLLTQGRSGYGPVYASIVEGMRPDVDVVDMFLRVRSVYAPAFEKVRNRPRSRTLPRDLAVAAAAVESHGGPVLLWPDVPDLAWSRLRLVRLRSGVFDELVRTPPTLTSVEPPPFERAVGLGSVAEFAGARLASNAAAPGQVVRVRYFWRLVDAPPAEGLEVVAVLGAEGGDLLLDARGQALLQDMHPLGQGVPQDSLPAGDTFAETLHLLVPRDTPPGTWRLWVGLRAGEVLLPTSEGGAFVPAARLTVRSADPALWAVSTSRPAADRQRPNQAPLRPTSNRSSRGGA